MLSRFWQAFFALILVSTSPVVGGFVEGRDLTAGEMYAACDALLVGRLTGADAETCDLYFSAQNMQEMVTAGQTLCMGRADRAQKIYAYVSYYAGMSDKEREARYRQPWYAVARDAFRVRWSC